MEVHSIVNGGLGRPYVSDRRYLNNQNQYFDQQQNGVFRIKLNIMSELVCCSWNEFADTKLQIVTLYVKILHRCYKPPRIADDEKEYTKQ